MNNEHELNHDQNYEWGSSPVMGHFLVENFDSVKKIPDLYQQLKLAPIFTNMLFAPLISNHKILDGDLRRIKFYITHPKTDEEDIIPVNPELVEIRNELMKEFGREVVRRINIYFSNGTEEI